MSSDGLTVVVLAGGQGTRLRSVTGDLPKALATVAGRAFLDWKLEELASSRVSRVELLTGFGSDQISTYLDEVVPPVAVTIRPDGTKPLGTGGSIIAIRDSLPERFVVTYGDSLLDEPLGPIWLRFLEGAYPAMMAVTQQFDSVSAGNVRVTGDMVERYAKDPADPTLTWLDYGYLCLSRDLLSGYPAGTAIDLGTVCSDLSASGKLAAMRVTGHFWEIGTPESLAYVEAHLGEKLDHGPHLGE